MFLSGKIPKFNIGEVIEIVVIAQKKQGRKFTLILKNK